MHVTYRFSHDVLWINECFYQSHQLYINLCSNKKHAHVIQLESKLIEISVSQLLLDLETYLADVSIGCSNPSQGERQDKFQDQVVYQENLHLFSKLVTCKMP